MIYPSQFESATTRFLSESPNRSHTITPESFSCKFTTHVQVILNQLRRIVYEDRPVEGRRCFPKTGMFRRVATSSEWVLITEITSRLKLELTSSSSTFSLAPSPTTVSTGLQLLSTSMPAQTESAKASATIIELDSDGFPKVFALKRPAVYSRQSSLTSCASDTWVPESFLAGYLWIGFGCLGRI
jgi:hypothetical protein